jgi:hypothetical protein
VPGRAAFALRVEEQLRVGVSASAFELPFPDVGDWDRKSRKFGHRAPPQSFELARFGRSCCRGPY